MKVKSESEVAQSCPTLAIPWTAAYQPPPSMGFTGQEYWSGVPSPSIYSLDVVLSHLEPVCSMSSSNCCFLTCIQISQDACQVIWYSHLLKNVPQFVVIHIVKGFGIVNKAEVDDFLELSCFLCDLVDVGNLISGFCASSKPA